MPLFRNDSQIDLIAPMVHAERKMIGELQERVKELETINKQLLEACEKALDEIIILTDDIEVFRPDYLVIAIAKAK